MIATGTAQDTGRLTTLGADVVIDYTAGPVAEQVRAAYPDGVDALIELAAFTARRLTAAGGAQGRQGVQHDQRRHEEALAAAGLTGTNIMAGPVREVVAPLADQAAAGTLSVDVTTVLPLERAADGLGTIASGNARGKIVVRISD